jgi:hypothetical protein
MANLTSIKEKIKNISDYSPQLAAYNDQLDDLINDAYYTIWTMRRWTFGFKEYYFRFHPDMITSRENPGFDTFASVVKGSREVTFAPFMQRLVPDIWEGQPIEIQNYEYIISKVVNGGTILLDQQFLGDTKIDDTSWRIKKRFYSLPEDCIELLSLGHRDVPNSSGGTGRFPPYGKIIGLMPRRDEELDLRMDYTATYAEAYIWSEAKNIPSGEKVALDFDSKVGAEGFLDNTYLEVCWAFVKDGLVGPLSKPEIIHFKNPEQAPPSYSLEIKFISWDDQSIFADTFQSFDVEPTQWEGYRKVPFWNANFNRATGERLGLPVWKTFNVGGATRNTTAYLDTVIANDIAQSVTINFLNQIDNGNKRYIEYDGQHLQIRPYPRVDAWDSRILSQAAGEETSKVDLQYLREGVARYYYKPQALGLQTDSPELPNEFHQLISYKVLETLYDKLGNMNNASLYRSRFEKEIKGLEKRYVNHVDSMMVRGQFVLGGWDARMRYDVNSLRKLS